MHRDLNPKPGGTWPARLVAGEGDVQVAVVREIEGNAHLRANQICKAMACKCGMHCASNAPQTCPCATSHSGCN